MDSVSLVEAEERLMELVLRASNGEATPITVGGQPVAQIVGLGAPKNPLAWEELCPRPNSYAGCAIPTDIDGG